MREREREESKSLHKREENERERVRESRKSLSLRGSKSRYGERNPLYQRHENLKREDSFSLCLYKRDLKIELKSLSLSLYLYLSLYEIKQRKDLALAGNQVLNSGLNGNGEKTVP